MAQRQINAPASTPQAKTIGHRGADAIRRDPATAINPPFNPVKTYKNASPAPIHSPPIR